MEPHKDDLETHIVQVLDQPGQTFASQVPNETLILFPTNEIAELIVEVWRRPIEVVKLL